MALLCVVGAQTFSVLGHWVSAVAATPTAPQWLEWELSLRPGMGIGRVQALQLPAADGAVHHQLTFDGKLSHEWRRDVVVKASAVQPAPAQFCQIMFSAISDCDVPSNASSCVSSPTISWAAPSIKVNLSPNPDDQNQKAQGCRRDLLFEFQPPDGKSVAVAAKARLVTLEAAGNWVAWSAVTFTMCPLQAS